MGYTNEGWGASEQDSISPIHQRSGQLAQPRRSAEADEIAEEGPVGDRGSWQSAGDDEEVSEEASGEVSEDDSLDEAYHGRRLRKLYSGNSRGIDTVRGYHACLGGRDCVLVAVCGRVYGSLLVCVLTMIRNTCRTQAQRAVVAWTTTCTTKISKMPRTRIPFERVSVTMTLTARRKWNIDHHEQTQVIHILLYLFKRTHPQHKSYTRPVSQLG